MESTYQSTVFGFDEPGAMWLTGLTLKKLSHEIGEEVKLDADGAAIVDSELYLITAKGIFRIE